LTSIPDPWLGCQSPDRPKRLHRWELRAQRARPAIEALAGHPKSWVRQEMRKVLNRLE